MVWRIQTTWFLSRKLSPNLLAKMHHSRISHPFGYFDFWLFWLLVLISCCSKLIALFIASSTELPHCVQWPYPFRRQDVCDKGWKVVPVHWGSFPVEWVVLLMLHVITLLLYWSTIDLQCCVSFRCTAEWFSFICVCACVCVCVLCCAQLLSHIRLFVTSRTAACQAPLSMEFPRQEYCIGLLFPTPGIFPTQALNPCLLYWQADSLPLHQLGSVSLYLYIWIISHYRLL